MRRSGGRVCALFDDRRAVSVVRYRPPGWERYDRARTRGRGVVGPVERADVLAALRRGRPRLVAHDEVRHLFAAARRRTGVRPAADRTGRRFRDWHVVRASDGTDRRGCEGREGRP